MAIFYPMLCIFQENIPLAPYTTFHVGGPARFFCTPIDIKQCIEALNFAHGQNLPWFVLGKGSNIVFSDQGYSGLVIYTGLMANIEWHEASVRVDCGALLGDVVSQSVDRGFAGMQNLVGIPGTMGGGSYINAGAFDQELKDVIVEVLSLDASGNRRHWSNAECEFGYRRSRFCGAGEFIVQTKVVLPNRGDSVVLRQEMEATLAKRMEKQPLHLPNAGSMFKRPPGQYAGSLIQNSGLKGFRMGNAGISDKHANFTVNLGGAKAQEIWDLTSAVIRQVAGITGVTLEREVLFIGDFLPWPR